MNLLSMSHGRKKMMTGMPQSRTPTPRTRMIRLYSRGYAIRQRAPLWFLAAPFALWSLDAIQLILAPKHADAAYYTLRGVMGAVLLGVMYFFALHYQDVRLRRGWRFALSLGALGALVMLSYALRWTPLFLATLGASVLISVGAVVLYWLARGYHKFHHWRAFGSRQRERDDLRKSLR